MYSPTLMRNARHLGKTPDTRKESRGTKYFLNTGLAKDMCRSEISMENLALNFHKLFSCKVIALLTVSATATNTWGKMESFTK